MNQADRDRRLRAVFDEALLQEPSMRGAYLDHVCAGDPELRPEVMRLLAAHEHKGFHRQHYSALLARVRAGIAYLEGATPLALRYLHDAAERFERADMKLYTAVARLRIGALQDDGHGHALRRQAEEWMAAQHIKNPACMTRMQAPGLPDMT